MDFNDDFMNAYFDEEYRVYGRDFYVCNDFVGAYICEAI